ncbi:hypothetical protein QFZ80_002869 [Paenibacillus sp. V4I7]|nr:hypothetical protein [Paenibacillus sp. V4I7]MDQ0914974.1 hypothetical protein [Paenibacillus sp. V4I5]
MWQRQEVIYVPEGHKIIYHPTAGTADKKIQEARFFVFFE